MKEKYLKELAKILRRAKNTKGWYYSREDEYGGRELIGCDSDAKDILNVISLLTPQEFEQLTKGYEDLELKDLEKKSPWQIIHQDDGIYIEKCEPKDSLLNGRCYSIVKGNKKLNFTLNTTKDKTFAVHMIERTEEGLYYYSATFDQIRFISNDNLKEMCKHWRIQLGNSSNMISDEEIIDGLTYSSGLSVLSKSGELIANNIFAGEKLNEERINFLFTVGLKEYIRIYSPGITYDYETEIPVISGWSR